MTCVGLRIEGTSPTVSNAIVGSVACSVASAVVCGVIAGLVAAKIITMPSFLSMKVVLGSGAVVTAGFLLAAGALAYFGKTKTLEDDGDQANKGNINKNQEEGGSSQAKPLPRNDDSTQPPSGKRKPNSTLDPLGQGSGAPPQAGPGPGPSHEVEQGEHKEVI